MAHFDTPRRAPFGAVTIYRFVQMFDRFFAALHRWSIAQKTDAVLRSLSDRELHDIGLSREGIEDFSAQYTGRG
ncbi:MAG: DUF1127 domain-containing protein [Pseudomonadota bacterium]